MRARAVECPVCKYKRISYKRVAKCNHNQDEEGTPTPVAKMVDVYAEFCTGPGCDGGLVGAHDEIPKVCKRCNGKGLEP